MLFQMTAKKVFGAKYERLRKSILIWAIVFFGLRIAEMQVEIAPFILYLMAGSFTAGVMWLALSSEDNRANRMNLFMMPFEKKELNAAYVSALGSYTLATKTMGLLCVAWAVSDWSLMEILGSVLSAVNAVWMSACVYAWRKRLRFGVLWGCLWCGLVAGMLLVMGQDGTAWTGEAAQVIRIARRTGSPQAQNFVFLTGITALLGNLILACLLTLEADAYAFYQSADGGSPAHGRLQFGARQSEPGFRGTNAGRGSERELTRKSRILQDASCVLVWRYLLRYMAGHENYLLNTFVMWGVACVLPGFLGQVGASTGLNFFLPIGFAIVSMNTPICILLSCDPALEQALRFLPGQKKTFCLSYGMFLFLCGMTAETIYLCSWQIGFGGVSAGNVLTAVCFALLNAAGSVLLEWFCPIRGWKIESDLWHHPRKYVVPGALFLLAAIL